MTMYNDHIEINKAFEEPLELSYKSLTGIDYRRPSKAQNGWLRFLVNDSAPRPVNLVAVMKEPTSIVLRASSLGANNAQNAYAYAMERLNYARSGEPVEAYQTAQPQSLQTGDIEELPALEQLLETLSGQDDLEYQLTVKRQET